MDRPVIESRSSSVTDWWVRERDNGGLSVRAAWASAALLITTLLLSIEVIRRGSKPGVLLSPLVIALLLVANLLPSIALMVLVSRNIARASAEKTRLGTGRLHTRLVALFSVIAAVPTVVVAIFASLLLQSGLEFWFSGRARSMLENTVTLAQGSYDREVGRVADQTDAMGVDLARELKAMPVDDPRFSDYFIRQVYFRELSEAVIFTVGADHQIRTFALVDPYNRPLDRLITADKVDGLAAKSNIPVNSSDRVGSLVRLDVGSNTYLYAARVFDPKFAVQVKLGQEVLRDYATLVARSRTTQLRFNVALWLASLVVVGAAIFAALRLADRLVRPVGELVDAAGRIEQGDFSARVETKDNDEIATLAAAFNRMSGRLEAQTGALLAANQQLDTRRAFIEAVVSSVTAGVIAVDRERRILLINRSAESLLHKGEGSLEHHDLARISPELAEYLAGDEREAHVEVHAESGERILAVKRMRYADGTVLTFDDITNQLSDQRRAAWSDIAQRIAHEIKNPLTPIQLAAERLQRRYAKEIQSDPETFVRLTETIVRQVGDLRRMVDEFSNFARMPKPVFREENLADIARAALFLHEVAHPGIGFAMVPPTSELPMVCDRRQLSQALTNVVKNAVEAIETRRGRGEHHFDGDKVELRLRRDGDQVVIDLFDTGIGLPEDRERLTEPYMTTRVRGTGLGLAIVNKIVEEHLGEIAFLDRKGGGTHVRIAFDAARLAGLANASDDQANNEEEMG